MNSRGMFHGKYQLHLESFSGPTPELNRAYIVPGQGSAFPGMFLHEFKTIPEFRELFAMADSICGFFDLLPVSTYITRPEVLPREKIHIYRNCALYVAEVACGEYMNRLGLSPSAITAHSFGECAGLVLAGALDFESMFSVVVHRNLECPPANLLGIMIAVSGTPESLQDLLAIPGVYLANRNSSKQIVISVAAEVKDEVSNFLRSHRVPNVVLTQLPQPYHSPLMETYRISLHRRIGDLNLKINEPKISFLSGVTHQWIEKSNYQSVDFVDLLSRQITEPVDFVEQMEHLKKRNINAFYEVGPGRMLETSIRSNFKNESIAYRDAESIFLSMVEELAPATTKEEMGRSRWFTKIKSVIQTVTGYKSDDIQISHSFQRDLGIDSIKKAEILFKIISEENITSSDFSITRFATIYQAVEYLENYSESADPLRTNHEAEISLLEPKWHEDVLPEMYVLERQKASFKIFRKVLSAKNLAEDLAETRRFVNEAAKDTKKPVVVFDVKEQSFTESDILISFLNLFKSWRAAGPVPNFHLVLVDSSRGEAYRGLSSMLKSIHKEQSQIIFLWIVADCVLSDEKILANALFSTTRDVRYQGGKRYIKDYEIFNVTGERDHSKSYTVVSVGGSRGINFEVLNRFPVEAEDSLCLIGRSDENDPAVSANIASLRKKWPRFSYLIADAMNFENLKNAITKGIGETKEIDIVLNSSGYEVSQSFESKEADAVLAEFESKWVSFQNIERLKSTFTVSKMLHYSSSVSEFGNKGQVVYSYANALIENTCRASGSQVVGWGPWENIGMTENPVLLQKFKEWGVSLVTAQAGADLIYKILFSKSPIPSYLLGFDFKDIFMCTVARSFDEANPIIGTVQNGFEACFFKEINFTKEPFLQDHTIFGKTVVPGSYMTATVASIARAQFSKMVSLKNVNIHNIMIIEEGHFQFKIQSFFRAPYEAKMYSLVPHFSANFDPEYVWPETHAPHFVPCGHMDAETFDNRVIFDFGPGFKLIKKAMVDADKNIFIEVDTNDLPTYLGDDYFDFLVPFFEIAYQSLTLQAHLSIQKVTMPLSCARVAFAPGVPITRRFKIFPVIRKTEENTMTADVFAENDRGEVFCKLTEVKVRLHKPIVEFPLVVKALDSKAWLAPVDDFVGVESHLSEL